MREPVFAWSIKFWRSFDREEKSNVPTLYSNIDVLTQNEIIVIQELQNWAKGIGLLHAHTSQFPNKQKHLHLYNTMNNPIPNQDLLNKIMSLCIQLQIPALIIQC